MTDTDYAALAESNGLSRIGARPPLWEYLKETWRRRHFAIALARFRVEANNSRTRLGVVWIVLRPILTATIYGLVFGLIMQSAQKPPNFLPYLFVGIFVFEFFTKSFADGAKSITGNASLVGSLRFPRVLLPLSVVIRQIIELLPVMATLLIIVALFGESPRWSWFMIIPVLAVYTLFNIGVALIAARLTVHFRDLGQLIPFITRILFYSSGIFFALEKVLANRPEILAYAQLNPVYDYISLARAYTIDGVEATAEMWIIAVVAAVASLIFGLIFFWRAEARYARD